MSPIYQYAGYGFWNREDCTDRAKRHQRDKKDWVTMPNAHPAIITEDEAAAHWEMVQGNKRVRGKEGRVSRYALSGGLLRCAHCGSNYAGATRRADDYR